MLLIFLIYTLVLPTWLIACLVQQGHPFMESLSENRPLLWSIALSGLAIVGLLTGSSPEFNEQFALVEIPTEVIWHLTACNVLLCGNRLYFFDVMSFSVHFLAVQANYCPGPGGRLCRCSAGGPCPTVPAGQRNSQAAFVNSVPIVTLAKQTVKGEKLWGRMKQHKLLGHKQTETLVLFSTVVYSSLWPGQLLLNQFCSDVLMICFNYFFLFSSWCFPATFSFL